MGRGFYHQPGTAARVGAALSGGLNMFNQLGGTFGGGGGGAANTASSLGGQPTGYGGGLTETGPGFT